MVRKKVEIKSHVLLLKHEKLDEKSSESLLKKYNLSKDQLPFINKKDPALKFLGDFEIGDILKISRDSPTTTKTTFYRVVIDG